LGIYGDWHVSSAYAELFMKINVRVIASAGTSQRIAPHRRAQERFKVVI